MAARQQTAADLTRQDSSDLIREARRHEHEFNATDNGGSRWSVIGNNGCIARVNFPAPALFPLIDSESETFDVVLGLAGESLDRLFASVYFLRPVGDFRDESARCYRTTRPLD